MREKTKSKKKDLDLLFQLYKLDRDEILQRNKQRDSYALQYIASVVAAIAAVASCNNAVLAILLLLPGTALIGCYYKGQIRQSYKIHKLLIAHIKAWKAV